MRETEGPSACRILTRFRTRNAAALLAYLAFYRERAHPRDALVEMLWPEGDLSAGRLRLRVTLASLRRELEPPDGPAGSPVRRCGALLIADRTTIQLNPEVCLTDVARFEAACRAAARAVRQPSPGPQLTRMLASTVELYTGELLPDAIAEWVLPERLRLAELFFCTVTELIARLEAAGDPAAALPYARRVVAADALREEAAETLIRLLAATGASEAARQAYQELERRLDAIGAGPPSFGLGTPSPAPARAQGPVLSLALPDADAAAPLPTGTITWLLVDTPAEEDRERLRALFRGHDGHELPAAGALLAIAFGRATDALAAAAATQGSRVSGVGSGVGSGPLPQTPDTLLPRVALHTGEVESGGAASQSPALALARQLLEAAQPGQILLSEACAALLARGIPPPLRLTPLGAYRLRSGEPPVRLFQVEPAYQTASSLPPPLAPFVPESRLPLPLTRFFGREVEIEQLCEAISRRLPAIGETGPSDNDGRWPKADGPRLVTLTGPGGSGKTRLALAVAARLQDMGADVWLVPFADLAPVDPGYPRSGRAAGSQSDRASPDPGASAPVPPPGRLAGYILEALRLPRSAGISPLEQVIAFFFHRLRDGRPALLLLDNFEYLVEEGAPALRALLERLPGLACLVTSRRRVGLEGERELHVPPLPVPVVSGQWSVASNSSPSQLAAGHWPLATVAACPSVALFLDRAQAVRPDFQLTRGNAAAVAALCVRLEGLPLALELAAARIGVLTPAQMLKRLSVTPADGAGGRFELLVSHYRSAPTRHRSLRAALEWGHQLLAPEVQRFFARLSVFRGGWTVEAAGSVCEEPHALQYLEQLRECSRVVVEEVGVVSGEWTETAIRFRFLETLREYAAEQLTDDERETTARRHAQFYLALAEQAEPGLKGPEQEVWLGRLDAEINNLRAALDWSIMAGSEEHGTGGKEDKREGWSLPETEPDPSPLTPPEIGLRLAGAIGRFWFLRGYWAEGLERLQALLAEESGVHPESEQPGVSRPSRSRAKALMWASDLSHGLGDLAAAHAFATESLATARALGDRQGIAAALNNLANVALAKSDLQSAHSLATQSLAIAREVGELWQAAVSLILLGNVTSARRDWPATRSLAAESLAICRALGDRRGIAMGLRGVAVAAGKQGDDETAWVLAEEALAISRGVGDPWVAGIMQHLGECARQQGDFGAAQAYFEESLTIARAIHYPSQIGSALLCLAELARARGESSTARPLLEESLANFRKAGSKPDAAMCLLRLARLAQERGDRKEAARLFAAADAEHTPADALLVPEGGPEDDARRAAPGETRGVQ